MSFLLVLLAAAAAAAVQHGRWTLVEGAEPKERVTLHVLLKHEASAVAALEATVRAVSDPTSAQYSQYLTREDVAALMAPAASARRRVEKFLVSQLDADIVGWGAHHDAVIATVDARLAEQVFGVEFAVWRNEHGRHITRSRKPHVVPAVIAEHVDLLLGLSDFSMLRRKSLLGKAASAPAFAAAASSSPTILAVMSRGGNTITADVQLVCSDGSTPSSVPPCQADPLQSLVVSADLALASTPQRLQGSANLQRCRAENGVVVCGVTLQSQFFQPASMWLATLTFTSGKVLTSSPFQFNAVATPPVLPSDLRAHMNIPSSEKVVAGATSCVVEFEQQYFSPADLAQFYAAVGVPVSNVNQVTVIGFNNASNPGGEAALDIEMLGAIAQNSPITFWSIKANSTVEIDDILKWAIAIANDTNAPQVNSLSYGMTEENVDQFLGKGYLKRSDIEFAKLAALGFTVIIASGDTGAGDLGPGPMSQPTCNTLHADWPSQSPYVTAVGSTYLSPLSEPACYGAVDCSNSPLGEVGVSVDYGLFWTSGGGFANRSVTGTGRAWYQKAAVQAYLDAAALPPAHAFDAQGRAYPDAVAVGHNLMVVLNKQFIPIDGTSASAPIFAAVITLLNDQRLRVGKKPLGLLNPLLYKLAEVAPDTSNEILVGNNRCGAYGFSPVCCAWGFPAAPGWSPVGGVGSPNYAALKREVLLLP